VPAPAAAPALVYQVRRAIQTKEPPVPVCRGLGADAGPRLKPAGGGGAERGPQSSGR